MFKKPKIKIFILLITTIIISGYLLISTSLGTDKFKNLKSLLSQEKKHLIKKYIFPYKFISHQQQIIFQQKQKLKLIGFDWSIIELDKKREGSEIITEENIVKLSDNKTLKKYEFKNGFYAGIYIDTPGSGYIDFDEDNIIVLSSRGILVFKKNIEDTEENFKQIKNNINVPKYAQKTLPQIFHFHMEVISLDRD